ncbi:MAG: HD family phosphohydrolase, partial [Chloroflexota bacterium]
LLLASYLYLFQPATWSSSRRLMLVYAVIMIGLLAAKLTIPGRDLWAYLFPVAAVPMLIAVLLDVHLAVAVLTVFAPLIGLVSGGSLELTTAALVGGLVGLLGIWRMERQAAAFVAGIGVALATFLVIVSFKLMIQDLEIGQLALVGAVCLVNGGLSTVLTLGTSTVLGHIFGVTTTPGLLELAHPSQPLFRRLLTQAPGTYHHSVVVANLAERAAQLVGADSLLTRVGAYYHDIGKVARPYCFVENQFEGENIHDKLNPQMSAKLVSAHVKDGLQLAKQHGLPGKIRDIIAQHHGTKLAKYFYLQACKDGCDKNFDESDFRYPGPRPQSKEAALVMLADSVEAAVRSSDDHSLENITRVVTRIVNETLIEGQLNECDLSIRDLQTTKEAFISVMQGIFHPRVKYPEPEDLAGETAGSATTVVSDASALPAVIEGIVPEIVNPGEAHAGLGGNP